MTSGGNRSVASILRNDLPHGRRERFEEDDEGSRDRNFERNEPRYGSQSIRPPSPSKAKVRFQEGLSDSVRRDPEVHHLGSRSSLERDPMAVHGPSPVEGVQQPLGKMGRMHQMQSPCQLHSSSISPSQFMPGASSNECDISLRTSATNEMDPRHPGGEHCEEHDQDCGFGVCGGSKEGQGKVHAQRKQEEEPSSRDRGDLRRLVRGPCPSGEGCEESGQGEGLNAFPIDHLTESEIFQMTSQQKTSLSQSVQSNWSVFDSSQALRDLRGNEGEHLWEICCSPFSALSREMTKQGFKATRHNYESGFDLANKQKVQELIAQIPQQKPTRIWASPKYAAVSSIQNLNQKTEFQRRNLYKKRLRTIREIRNLIDIFRAAYARRPGATHLYMEWPKNAVFGWKLREWEVLRRWLEENFSQKLYFAEIHGCMHGLKFKDELINKQWYVLTTDFDFFCSATIKCDGSHTHRQVVGMGSEAVHSTAFYPESMVRRIVQIWKKQWFHVDHSTLTKNLYNSKVNDSELKHLLQESDELCAAEFFPATTGESSSSQTPPTMTKPQTDVRDDGNKDEEYVPTDKEREKVRSMLHRLHRAAGHPTNSSLARLCQTRKMAPWIVHEAKHLRCQACSETQRGAQKVLPVSISDQRNPWEIIAMDAFELSFPHHQTKARYIIMMCTAMHFVAVACTWTGALTMTGTDPGHKVIDSFCNTWLLHRPRPRWVLMDSQTSFAQGVFPEFLQTVGIGSAVTAPEAHWQNGVAESLIGALKRTMRRLRTEDTTLSPEAVATLAAFSHNHMHRQKGFSPIQWAYGVDPDAWENPNDPLFANKSNLFGSETFSTSKQTGCCCENQRRGESKDYDKDYDNTIAECCSKRSFSIFHW